MAESIQAENKGNAVLRRDFLTGAAVAAGALASVAGGAAVAEAAQAAQAAQGRIEPSTGYLVYDSRLCFGCQSCMYACALTHEGVANPSLARIQIIRDAPGFTRYPHDVVIAVCRHCVAPVCVQSCPVGACYVDAANGNIRRIDEAKCIGCQMCINSCPHRPRRTIWNPAKRKATKCDLCVDSPHWSEEGGPEGKQACVESCAARALRLVRETPPQKDVSGYDVNLAPPPKPKMAPKAKPGGDPKAKPAAKEGA